MLSRTKRRAQHALPLLFGASTLAALSSCGRPEAAPNEPGRLGAPPAADVPELEIRASGIDRFTICPPPGDLGQHWIPPVPPWTPTERRADAGAIHVDVADPPKAGGAPRSGPAGSIADEEFIARTKDRTLTEIAVDQTHRAFRSCYRQGLVRHPTQDGRVAIVLRIGPDGRVAKVESFAACELATESISCMYGVAERLRFPPPSGGSDTIMIPAVFTSRDGVRRTVPTPNDAYTAGAYVTIETARSGLHGCEDSARREGRAVTATGTFTMDVAPDGHVVKAHVDPWTGEQTLLMCAARVLEGLRFAAPEGGRATVIARLNFNPRQGTR
jgi:hypothetical protein